jgi:hypothetical protein
VNDTWVICKLPRVYGNRILVRVDARISSTLVTG